MKESRFCGSVELVKNGVIRGMQRHKCKGCGKSQLPNDGRIKYSNKEKQMAIAMYLNNVGFRAIGRVMKIPFQIIHGWVRKAGELVEREVNNKGRDSRNIVILEMDELYTYIQKKSGKYEYGLLLIGTEMKLLRIM